MGVIAAKDTAKYLLFLARSMEAGETISNLKMQKLLYYAQGWHLALYNTPLFDERIEVWDLGPVVPTIYHDFKQYRDNSISFDELNDFNTDKMAENSEAMELLVMIFKKYALKSAYELVQSTHAENTWLNAYKKGLSNEITKDAMKEHFLAEIDKMAEQINGDI